MFDFYPFSLTKKDKNLFKNYKIFFFFFFIKRKKKKRNYSNLVDPASSHMLVSKTKPCMSKYKRVYTVKLRMAH